MIAPAILATVCALLFTVLVFVAPSMIGGLLFVTIWVLAAALWVAWWFG